MPTAKQIKLVHIAAKAAGLISRAGDGRYRLLLGKYKQGNRRPVTSSTQLNNWQIDDFLAICEAQGWRYPGKPDDFFRKKRRRDVYPCYHASYAQQEAIRYLAGDLGWGPAQVCGLAEKRILGKKAMPLTLLTPDEAYKVIEALKAILGRARDKTYVNLNLLKEDMEADKDVETCPI